MPPLGPEANALRPGRQSPPTTASGEQASREQREAAQLVFLFERFGAS